MGTPGWEFCVFTLRAFEIPCFIIMHASLMFTRYIASVSLAPRVLFQWLKFSLLLLLKEPPRGRRGQGARAIKACSSCRRWDLWSESKPYPRSSTGMFSSVFRLSVTVVLAVTCRTGASLVSLRRASLSFPMKIWC